MSTAPVVHVTFGAAPFGNLKHALDTIDRRERVIGLYDDLSLGPITRTSGRIRTKWAREELRNNAFGKAADIDRFWAEALATKQVLVAWVSRRSAREYAGLLELHSKLGDAPLLIVDITDEHFGDPGAKPDERSLGIGHVPYEQILSNNLIGRAAPIPARTANRYRKMWSRLKEANAPMRVISNGELVSTSIDYYDSLIVASAASTWRSTLDVLADFYAGTRAAVVEPPGAAFGWARIAAMVRAGTLEGEGDFANVDNIRLTRVRRRAR